ncbi:MAG: MerR family transcriptional regulator [Micavibrio aeruginosavorus]|nr:MerR family transcriptional regulator [Micavibrio aeruginosavorus]
MTGLNPKQAHDFDEKVDQVLTEDGAETASGRKAPGAFRTISEVADELDVQQHVLRFWETKFSQVRPLKRGGGRRYYRPEDVALLKKIHTLLYTEGYTIKGVQKLLKTQGKAQLLADAPQPPQVAVRAPAPANEQAVQRISVPPVGTASVTVSRSVDLSDKQRSILQAMLGDLRDLRNMISPDGKGE